MIKFLHIITYLNSMKNILIILFLIAIAHSIKFTLSIPGGDTNCFYQMLSIFVVKQHNIKNMQSRWLLKAEDITRSIFDINKIMSGFTLFLDRMRNIWKELNCIKLPNIKPSTPSASSIHKPIRSNSKLVLDSVSSCLISKLFLIKTIERG